jgi:RNA polymerase sigma-70 factor (ECF subfamily)
LRAGDEAAFARIVREWHPSMLRVARIFVPSRAIAEDVVQETWVRVLGALERFEGRSSLKTWVFRILVNTAKTRAQREGRVLPFSALGEPFRVPEPAVDPARFLPEDDERFPGAWSVPPRALPEERLLAAETRARVEEAIDALPSSQAAVIRLRDVDGWSAEEVCNALDLTEVNQRVLLHRARAKVRAALEEYLSP